MNFGSDNSARIDKRVMAALADINQGSAPSYGFDQYSLKLKNRFSDIFEKDVSIFLVSTGTAANSLALSALVSGYQESYCHSSCHLQTNECGAPLLFTGGSFLKLISGLNGKIDSIALEKAIKYSLQIGPSAQNPGCISITQAIEHGTVYTLEELRMIKNIALCYDLPIHMDGARFANSLVRLSCKPSDITWKVGVDVMSFGATKNGCLMDKVVLFFNEKYAKNFPYLHKRSGQLLSKIRFFSAQLIAYLDNDIWLENALYANRMAQLLADAFARYSIFPIYPVDINELFVNLAKAIVQSLRKAGCTFYR